MKLLQVLIAGMAAGWIMGRIRKGKGKSFNWLGCLVIGGIGSIISWYMMGFMQIQSPNFFTRLVLAVTGAAFFFFLLELPKRKKKKKPGDDE